MSEKEIQFSIDAVGTILYRDLPKIIDGIADVKEDIESLDDRERKNYLELKELRSAIGDVDAKLELVLGKLDLLEKRVANILSEGTE